MAAPRALGPDNDHAGVDPAAACIVLRGIMQRSGTNFVHDLLRLHPDVGSHPGLFEDHLFGAADLLCRYADLTVDSWRASWPLDRHAEHAALLAGLGSGIAHYLHGSVPEPIVATKMPSCDGIGIGLRLLPAAAHLVVVRDGRAVVESATRSFDEPFDRETRRWADGARMILAAQADHGDALLVVRYEDLVADLRSSLGEVLAHCRLDATRYPWDEAEALPVRGSSELVGTEEGIHWSPIDRTRVDPTARAVGWDDDSRARFDAIAGPQLEALGYPRDPVDPAGFQIPSVASATWSLRRSGGRARRWLRARL